MDWVGAIAKIKVDEDEDCVQCRPATARIRRYKKCREMGLKIEL